MAQDSTTVRVSRRAHQIFSELAALKGGSVTDYLDRLAERERRQAMLSQYNARMAELLAEPVERDLWTQETLHSEASAAELT